MRGIVGGKSLGIIGGVVLNLTMLKLGEASGPECLVRFKVTEAGGADGWVGFILGARAIDCPERGGLGHVPGQYSHYMTALNIMMERVDPVLPPRRDKCYCTRSEELCGGVQLLEHCAMEGDWEEAVSGISTCTPLGAQSAETADPSLVAP